MAWWMLPLGAGLLALVLYDSLVTTVATNRAAGPLTARLGQAWALLAWRATSNPRSPILSSMGPVVIVLTIGSWLALLWSGWALIFSADTSAVVAGQGAEPAGGWARTYYAGYSVFTLGIGDYVPGGGPWQVLTVFATISGLGLTTLAITYLVPVVSAVTQRRKQAHLIATLGDNAEDIVVTVWHQGSLAYLDQLLPQLADGLMLTAKRHLSYPILHYFHPSGPEHDLRAQAPLLDDALSLIEFGIDDPTALPNPAAIRMGRSSIHQLLARESEQGADCPAPPPPRLQSLRDAGIPTVDDTTFTKRLTAVHEHRRVLATYGSGSTWRTAG